jgi:hypothetical protein
MNWNLVVEAGGGGGGGGAALGAGCRTGSGGVWRCREGGEGGVGRGGAVGAGCNGGGPSRVLLAATKWWNDCWKLLDMMICSF